MANVCLVGAAKRVLSCGLFASSIIRSFVTVICVSVRGLLASIIVEHCMGPRLVSVWENGHINFLLFSRL